MSRKRLTRRTFITYTSAALASLFPRRTRAATQDKLRIACVGVGGQGAADLRAVSRENIVALCDVDQRRAADAFKAIPKAAKYTDWRQLLDKEHANIDAVVVATPDHQHAFVAHAAMDLGKHVYVEKPMAHTIVETRALMKKAADTGVVTQMGNQGHSWKGVWQLKEMIDAGVIGKVREAHAWTNRPTWPQGIDRPADSPPIPEGLDWDLWLGPAQLRPYNPAYAPRTWRGWWDFGEGAMGDMGCHILDPFVTVTNMTAPQRISAESSPVNDETAPGWSIIRYQFPDMTLTWYDGGKMPQRPELIPSEDELGDGECGTIFIGDKGLVMVGTYGTDPTIYPLELRQQWEAEHGESDARSLNHQRAWVDACKGGEDPALSHFGYSGPLTELSLLGNVALRAGEPIEWDAAAIKVTNLPSANAYLTQDYRQSW
ncbi:MAG: Gfo/Idh/MocA family oxidoreductase [Candidatus Hydrogenedentales bacterium]